MSPATKLPPDPALRPSVPNSGLGRFLAARPMLADALLALVLFLPVYYWANRLAYFYALGSSMAYLLFAVVLAVGYVVPLIWRRTRPDVACLAILPVFLVQLTSWELLLYGPTLNFGHLPALILLYSAAKYSKRHIIWLSIAMVGALGAGLVLMGRFLTGHPIYLIGAVWSPSGALVAALLLVGLFLAAWALGRRFRDSSAPELGRLRPTVEETSEAITRLQRWWHESPQAKDVLLAVVFFVPIWAWASGLYLLLGGYPIEDYRMMFGAVIALGYTLPLAWRRTRPDLACLLVIPVHLLQLSSEDLFTYGGFPLGNLVVPVLLYSAARHSRHANVWLAVGLVASLTAGLRWMSRYYWWEALQSQGSSALLGPAFSVAVLTFACALVVVASWGAGRIMGYRVASVDLARGRTDALEREREQIRRLAAEQERSRIAREMHDIVAHSLSVIVVQADGASYTLNQPVDPSRQLVVAASALEVIGSTARTALSETRRLVGVLRSDDQEAELAPMVDLAAIPGLLDRTRAAGLPLESCIEGDPQAHPPLGASVETAAYRIVQEALTNVMKHAGPGAFATVLIEHTPVGLSIAVRDDGRGPGANDGSGHGLIGMHERVAAFGGTLVTRARDPHGFEVLADLPAQGVTGRLER